MQVLIYEIIPVFAYNSGSNPTAWFHFFLHWFEVRNRFHLRTDDNMYFTHTSKGITVFTLKTYTAGYLLHCVPDQAQSCVQRLVLHVDFRRFWKLGPDKWLITSCHISPQTLCLLLLHPAFPALQMCRPRDKSCCCRLLWGHSVFSAFVSV